MKKNISLIILDGYGLSESVKGNAVKLAKTPFLNKLFNEYPNNTLMASGSSVGLPEGQMGNSEVGHLNLGAGRVVYQSLSRINKSIENKDFFKNKIILEAFEHAKKNKSKVHILGLVSDGGVHSHINHVEAIFELANTKNIPTYLHAFTDGRDTNPKSGLKFISRLLDLNIKISTISGRYYAMDRDNNWSRIQKCYDAMTLGKSNTFSNPKDKIKEFYKNGITDEFIEPFVVDPNGRIEDNDSIVFINFRPDRAIRLATAISNPDATSDYISENKPTFKLKKRLDNIFFVSMMYYSESVSGKIAFPFIELNQTLGEIIENNELTQLRLAETEKYPHVTFFFDGGVEKKFENSKRILVESPKVKTYDLKPEMSAIKVKNEMLNALSSERFDLIVLNFANPDMVGHTGSLDATIKSIETIDSCMKEIIELINKKNGIAIVLSDHGNSEKMINDDGSPHTAHTTNLVPIAITDKKLKIMGGSLCDVAPTILKLMNIKKPKSMTGKSLI